MRKILQIFGEKRRTLGKPKRWDLYVLPRSLVLLIIFAVVVLLVSSLLYEKEYTYEIGKPAIESIIADFDFQFEDVEETEKKREQVLKTYDRYFLYDYTVNKRIYASAEKMFQLAQRVQNANEIPDEEKIPQLIDRILRQLGFRLSKSTIETLLYSANDAQFRTNVKDIITHILEDRGVIREKSEFENFEAMGVIRWKYTGNWEPKEPLSSRTLLGYPEDVSSYLRWASKKYFSTGIDARALRSAAVDICEALLVPNISFLLKESQEVRKHMLAEIEPAMKKVTKGQTIIPHGEPVIPFTGRVIDTLNTHIKYYSFLRSLAYMVVVFVLMVFIKIFIKKIQTPIPFTTANIVLLSLPVILALFLGRMLLLYLPEEMAGYAFPAGVIGMLGVTLISPQAAVLLVVMGCILFGFMMNLNFTYVLIAFIGGMTAIASLYQFQERKDVLTAGIYTGVANFLGIILITFIIDPTAREVYIALWGLVNGIACGFIALPSMVFFEKFFGVTTDVRLLELTGIKQPLLREFEEKAPGSYQHTLNLANLAEQAAIDIGANYLLVRAGAFYHDVGKIVKPNYYSENQASVEDKKVHLKISPHMSALVIKNHVREGIEIARKYGLSQKVIDFIPQHHGTSLIRYFYQEAVRQYENTESAEPVREEDFRYPGPKPQTIEAAIVMLADSVEATATSKLSEATVREDDIRLVVRNSILEKFNDGQFVECNLTLRDLHRISESFIKTLLSRYHHRIAYPALIEKREEREELRPELKPSTSAAK